MRTGDPEGTPKPYALPVPWADPYVKARPTSMQLAVVGKVVPGAPADT